MKIIKIILLIPTLTLTYNIDIDYPIIYSDTGRNVEKVNSSTSENNYFGYSVLLHFDQAANKSWLIVGAPRGYYSGSQKDDTKYPQNPGVVYRCGIWDTCTYIKSENDENENGYIMQLGMKTLIKKDDGWFGAAMSIERKSNLLTICAPRTIMSIYNPFEKQHVYTMHGMCYNGIITSGIVSIENKDAADYNFRSPFWYNPLHGFSVHYPSLQDSKYAKSRIIGEPKHDLYGRVDIKYLNRRKSIDLPIDDELAQFGYSVTSGHYFGKDQLYFAAGAPGWQYVGQVAIISPLSSKPVIVKLQGNDVGEFFGASLATGDFDNDGFHDLLVGAPHWGQDEGKVYIYLGNSMGKFETGVTIEGTGEGSQFGYSLACGDLDADGFSDIIVGAPWEDSGVIYIYNGDADFRDKDRLVQSQRIAGSSTYEHLSNPGRKIERFGFSLSEPIDIDNNGYPDIAVGSFKSGHAIIFRSKSVLETTLNVSATPNVLRRNTANLWLSICVTNYINTQAVKITIDEKYKRTDMTTMNVYFEGTSETTCNNKTITMKADIQNYIDPINIFAEHAFVQNTSTFCSSCAMEYKGRKSKVAQLIIPFDIGCGVDNVCNSNISVVSKFYGTQDNDTWLIGSNDISLEATLTNHGEPAHLLSLTFVLPQGIMLRSILPTCQEDTVDNKVIVVCDMGNALEKESPNSVKLDLDMKHMVNGMLHNQVLEFLMLIKTRSKNDGSTEITKTLTLKSQASLSLNGKAHEESYYLPSLDQQTSNVSFQQTYQIIKHGVTPLIQAQLVLMIPVAKKDRAPFLHIYKPQLYITGKIFECISQNVSFLKTRDMETHNDVSTNQFDLFSKMNNKTNTRSLNETLQSYSQITQIVRGVPMSTKRDNKRDRIYLNCTRNDIKCAHLICDISELKTQHDIGKLLMKLIFDTANFKETFPRTVDIKSVIFSTEAHVTIIEPKLRSDVPGTRSLMQLTTSFYLSPKVQKLQLWVYIVSVSLGLVLLCIIIIVLSTLGFFKRKKSQDLSALNADDTTTEESQREVDDDATTSDM